MRPSKTLTASAFFAFLAAQAFALPAPYGTLTQREWLDTQKSLDSLAVGTICSNPGQPSCAELGGERPSGEQMMPPGMLLGNIGGAVSKCFGLDRSEPAVCEPCLADCQRALQAEAEARFEKAQEQRARSEPAPAMTLAASNPAVDLLTAMRHGPSAAGNPSDVSIRATESVAERLARDMIAVQNKIQSGRPSKPQIAYAAPDPRPEPESAANTAAPAVNYDPGDCAGTFRSLCDTKADVKRVMTGGIESFEQGKQP